MGTLAALIVCAGCASSADKPATDDSGAVTQADPPAGGKNAPSNGGPKPGGSGGSSAAGAGRASTPAAGSGSHVPPDAGTPVMIEKPSEYDAGSDPDRNKVMPAQLCQRIAEINCAGEAYCCDSPGRSLDACKQDLISQCTSTLMLDRIAMQSSAGFDAAAAEKAYIELEHRASACDVTAAMWGASPDGLRGILKGSIEPKASCRPASTIPEVAEAGAALLSCLHPETNACVYMNILDDWTCEPRAGMGGPCVTDNNCSDGFYCVPGGLGESGTCGARKPVGESCQSPSECSSLFCKKKQCVEASKQAAYCLTND